MTFASWRLALMVGLATGTTGDGRTSGVLLSIGSRSMSMSTVSDAVSAGEME